jgi:hypothetical protein
MNIRYTATTTTPPITATTMLSTLLGDRGPVAEISLAVVNPLVQTDIGRAAPRDCPADGYHRGVSSGGRVGVDPEPTIAGTATNT